ncbi:uncharacterized protein [Diadema antillarum]|uniref:uncharacterized protein n=1 Tax=Diadema antillarum TaxID=105358 RepID=UPI003A8C4E9B
MKASFFDGYFSSEEDRFNIDVNYSLVITDLQTADEGIYYCQVMLENVEILFNSTNLTVNVPVIETDPTIHGWTGEDIQLPCDFKEEPLAVYWVKESMSNPELSTSKAFYDGDFVSMEQRFDIDENFNLFITDLAVSDEGLYICQVVLHTFDNFANSSRVFVSSMASTHAIEECVGESQPNPRSCTYQTPSNIPSVYITCVVSGFKPNVTMLWTEETGKRLSSVVSQQTTLSDDTYERFETITVTAKHGTEQTFICTATGDSVNGASTAEITVLPIPGKRRNLGLIIGLAIGVLCALVILMLLARRFLWKVPDNQRDKLRRKIRSYVPGMAYFNEPFRGKVPSKVNIVFFGEIAAGKSSLINSLNYALTGKYSTVTDEGYTEHSGGKTHHILTDRIDLIDTRGTDFTFSFNTLQRLKDEINICYPIIVVTHENEYADKEAVRQDIYRYMPYRPAILMFENYIQASNEEDVEKDIEYLEFLWSALERFDWTLHRYR